MKLLVSQRTFLYEKYNENRDCIDQRIVSWVLKLGYYPVLVPNNLLDKKNFLNLRRFIKETNPKGLILTGGEDIGEITGEFGFNKYSLKFRCIIIILSLGSVILGSVGR